MIGTLARLTTSRMIRPSIILSTAALSMSLITLAEAGPHLEAAKRRAGISSGPARTRAKIANMTRSGISAATGEAMTGWSKCLYPNATLASSPFVNARGLAVEAGNDAWRRTKADDLSALEK